MSDYPSPVPSSAPPAQRNRRSGRTQGRHAKPKKPPLIAWWQWLVLAALAGLIVYQVGQLNQATAKLDALYQARREEQERYQKSVDAHEPKYRDLIEQYAAEYQINPAYVSAIIKQESNYDPRAVSSKGARGLMQFMPDTFEWVKKNCGYRSADFDKVYEPEAAIKMGCYLLRYIVKQIGTDDPILVACAYHAGWGVVPTWLQNYSSDGKTLRISEIPKTDTQTYAGRVVNSYAIYLQHYY
ncbi:MAG: lytic transglycosylase domain-containing protein [Clostridia bacterium]|nr:lytic transglycosylase domain-containing protein [Clostridia bacterium]